MGAVSHYLHLYVKCFCADVSASQAIGNGIPLGAIVATTEIANILTHQNYLNPFGGSCVYFCGTCCSQSD